MFRDIEPNQTHRYFHSNFNMTTMMQPDEYRKLVVNLEPCHGVVYLFIRKALRCWPNPYSCINMSSGQKDYRRCTYTHFMSQIDGTRDATPTFFEIPLTSTKFYISVFGAGKTPATYTLMLLSDIGALPRPGPKDAGVDALGQVVARQTSELSTLLSWHEAYYKPEGITETKQYWVYTSMLAETDNHSSTACFLWPEKIMNTVCGLKNNTDRHYDIVSPSLCANGICNLTIHGVAADKRYVFNVVAESQRGYMMPYAGMVMRTQWIVSDQMGDDVTVATVGAMSGSCLALVVIVYAILLKLYG